MPRRIAIIGPTHPYSGGIAAHTSTLAHRLIEAGHTVDLVSWKAQYPRFLRDARVPQDRPEVAPVPGTTYPLAWYSPLSWWRVGRRLRSRDLVVVTAVTPYHALPSLVTRAALGRRRRALVLSHNVLPHEGGMVDWTLLRRLFRGFGRVLTHSDSEAALAQRIAGPTVRVAAARMPLPDFLFADGSAAPPGQVPDRGVARGPDEPVTLVFFGMVREYKGVDVLLSALAQVPGLRLIVAGEFWQPIEDYRRQVAEGGLTDRVELREGYVDIADVPALLAQGDALVLPYRRGSATFNVDLGFRFGLPVIATDAGTLARDIRDGVDGLVARAGDVESLAAVLRRVADPAELDKLRAGVDPARTDAQWADYVRRLLNLAFGESDDGTLAGPVDQNGGTGHQEVGGPEHQA